MGERWRGGDGNDAEHSDGDDSPDDELVDAGDGQRMLRLRTLNLRRPLRRRGSRAVDDMDLGDGGGGDDHGDDDDAGLDERGTAQTDGPAEDAPASDFVASAGGSGVKRQSGPLGTTANLLKGFMGSGMLGLPFAFKQSGLLAGVLIMVCVGTVSSYCLTLLVRCKQLLEFRGASSYTDVGRMAVGRCVALRTGAAAHALSRPGAAAWPASSMRC